MPPLVSTTHLGEEEFWLLGVGFALEDKQGVKERRGAQRHLASEAFTISYHSSHLARRPKVSQFEGVHSEPERKICNKILCSAMNFNVLVIVGTACSCFININTLKAISFMDRNRLGYVI
ncbi:hypothetical protein ACRRTK_015698 [Alexandromys fortis]